MSESPPSLPILDLEELRDRAGRDEELVMELLGDFLARVTEVTLIVAAASSCDYVKVGKLAHRTKGSLLALGAKAAARAAADVEQNAAIVRDKGPSPTTLAQLETALATLAAAFDVACGAMRKAQTGASTVTSSMSSGWR